MKQDLNKLKQLINESKNILIISHMFPDPDAVGSSIGMREFVNRNAPNSKVDIKIHAYGKRNFKMFQQKDEIERIEDFASEVKKHDLIIFVDAQEAKRFFQGLKQEDLSGLKIACVDHHPYEECGYDFEYVDDTFISCSDLIYEVLLERKVANKDIAYAMFLGLVSDSGGGRYIKKHKIRSMQNIYNFINDFDFTIEDAQDSMDTLEKDLFEIYRSVISNIEFYDDLKLTYSHISTDELERQPREMLKKVSAQYLFQNSRSIEGYNWGIMIIPYSNVKFGISFRSKKGGVNVSLLAENFGGGGHIHAAGGSIYFDEPKTSKEAALEVIKQIKFLELKYT